MKPSTPFHLAAARGYTLIEVLLSLFLLIAIAVPMISALFSNTASLRAQEALTAVWLLEQEATKIRYFPEAWSPSIKRTLNGREWTITTEMTGTPLALFRLTAINMGKKRGELYVYGIISP